MGDLKHEGYLEGIEEMSLAQEENSVFEQDFEKFKSLIFTKGKVHRGRWWVGVMTYQQMVDSKFAEFAFVPGSNGDAKK